jgi:hypothetical protein
MSQEYTLFPALSEEGKKEAQALIEDFKIKMLKVCEEVLSHLYTDVVLYIESDSWGNFRNEILDGFKDYNNHKIHSKYDFQEIRQAILREHKEEIIADLNRDMIAEIELLKKELSRQREFNRASRD